jgi:hypothetical protein
VSLRTDAVLFGLFGSRYTADPEVAAALDYLIERIDPRLALVGGCRRTLGKPAQRALEFAHALVAKMPAPIELRAERWASEPRLRAFFAAARDIGEILGRGPGVRAFFDGGADEGFALLGMTRKTQRVLTQALQGEMLHADVARTSVSFTDHRVSSPSATVEALRADLERRVLDFVAERAAARLQALDSDRKQLETERDVLKARMRLAGREGHGLAPADGAALAASLKKCEARLTELAGALRDRVSMVAETLAAPEKQLQLAVHTLRLDQMNFVVEAADAACAEVTFVEAVASAELSRVLVPVRIFRAELGPARDALADAEKLL